MALTKDDKSQAYDDADVSTMTTAVDILSMEHTDPVLDAKMRLVNNVRPPQSLRARQPDELPSQAIDEIGFTMYQWKMFFLNGFG